MPLFHPKYDADWEMTYEGITLLEYYAAHAPECPDWFSPVMTEIPEEPIGWWEDMDEESVEFIDKYWNAEFYVWDHEYHFMGIREAIQKDDDRGKKKGSVSVADLQKVEAYGAAMKYREDMERKNEANFEIEKLIQWRFYYARKMVEQTHSSD